MRFRALAGSATVSLDDSWHYFGMKDDLTGDEASFALAYAIDCILKIEATVEDVRKPFGREFWY